MIGNVIDTRLTTFTIHDTLQNSFRVFIEKITNLFRNGDQIYRLSYRYLSREQDMNISVQFQRRLHCQFFDVLRRYV